MPRLGQKLGFYCKVDNIVEGQIQRIIREAPNLEYKSLYAFLFLTGVRASEGLRLTKADFHVRNSYLAVDVFRLKRKDKPTIPIQLPLNAPFIHYILERLRASKGKVWTMTRTEAWKVLKVIDPKMTLHSFRHSRANFLAEFGDGNPYRLASWFGWKRLETSMAYMEKHGRLSEGLSPLLTREASR